MRLLHRIYRIFFFGMVGLSAARAADLFTETLVKAEPLADNLNGAVYQYNLSRLELAPAKSEVRDVLREKTS
ncbi:MAG: hypothetical protein KGJ37_00565 [Verrucomicrobiota bacterium]|nr:hypothetical protein [Verrucomicrobiota bacterium]